MFSRLEVQHFKSLEHAIVDLGMINIFVGQNGSGKSNIVDAVRFLKDAASISLDRAVSDRHGIESVRQWSPTRPYRIHLSIAFEETGTYGSYSVDIDLAKGQLKVFSEEVTSKSKELYDLAEIEDDDSDEDTEGVTGKGRFYSAFMRGRVARDKEGNVTSTVERHAFRGEEFRTESIDAHFDEFRGKPEVLKFRGDQFDELVFNFRPMWPLYEVRRILNNFQAYSIYPNTLRIPQDPSN